MVLKKIQKVILLKKSKKNLLSFNYRITFDKKIDCVGNIFGYFITEVLIMFILILINK